MQDYELLGRDESLFAADVAENEKAMSEIIGASRFLIIGGAGSIGSAVVRELFKRDAKSLDVVDISENNLVELVRGLRSSIGYNTGDFRTFALDCGSHEFARLMDDTSYDFVLNLSALKHVRSEKDPYTLMRMIRVNILNTIESLEMAASGGARKYFCVSTDKAANPVNMMGASKRIMEMFLFSDKNATTVSTARFANVAFSDGSLLQGFNNRFLRGQPISAPRGIERYFLTQQESGELSLMSALFGDRHEIFFPKDDVSLTLTKFTDIAKKFLLAKGFEPVECQSESEAREMASRLIAQKKWPVYFFKSDTSGEKYFEEFYTKGEQLDYNRYGSIGIVKHSPYIDGGKLKEFLNKLKKIELGREWRKSDFIDLFNDTIENFNHIETGRNLDQRM
jgi:FlaA1/EpsC-like NDP-sugar epimerase